MKLHKRVLCAAGVALLLSGTSLIGAEKSAKSIMSNAYQYLGSMDKYSFNAVVSENGDPLNSYKQNVSAKVSRPDKLRVDTKGNIKNRSNYINNGTYTMMDHNFGFYGQLKTPKSIEGTLDFIFDKYGIKSPMASLFYKDMDKRMKLKKSKYFGVINVDGVSCDYIAFKNNSREIHVWIATGDTPLVKAYSIIDSNDNSRVNTSLVWNKNSSIKAEDFVFVVPHGASKIVINSAK